MLKKFSAIFSFSLFGFHINFNVLFFKRNFFSSYFRKIWKYIFLFLSHLKITLIKFSKIINNYFIKLNLNVHYKCNYSIKKLWISIYLALNIFSEVGVIWRSCITTGPSLHVWQLLLRLSRILILQSGNLSKKCLLCDR